MDPNTRALIMGAGGGAAAEKIYVEDVFSTFLYTGNDSTQTITNAIDLSGKGGLVWIKCRTTANSNNLYDTTRGATKYLASNNASAESTLSQGLTAFGSTGFTLGSDNFVNASAGSGGGTYASWTFRKAAKFFDVVTYVGTGSNQNIAHNLGSAPGFILIKRTDSTSDWFAYPRYADSGNSTFPYLYKDLRLNTTAASVQNLGGLATSTVLSANSTGGNINGASYVAYLFAHDAGGFGDSGSDNVVSCGSYTTNGSGVATVTLGWEPQWVLVKRTDASGIWILVDTMRGWTAAPSNNNYLQAESSAAETQGASVPGSVTSTGFSAFGVASASYIYIAIRRGPMKTPTDATEVFASIAATNSNGTTRTTGFPVDLQFRTARGVLSSRRFYTRLLGVSVDSAGAGSELYTDSISAESTGVSTTYSWWNTGYTENNIYTTQSVIAHNFRRAPGFFDVVAYTGTGVARTVSHNLGVAPELMIVKRRESDFWMVYTAALGNTKALNLNNASAPATLINNWNNTSPTSTVFTVGTATDVNASGGTYVAYLFATLTGISKVGSYTGTGTTQQINCGFTAGARFVLIKRTDSTGDWYVWDTARGIISGNDPYLLLNSTAAEVTSTDYIDPLNSGFEISSTAPAAINANGGTFIYLAIA